MSSAPPSGFAPGVALAIGTAVLVTASAASAASPSSAMGWHWVVLLLVCAAASGLTSRGWHPGTATAVAVTLLVAVGLAGAPLLTGTLATLAAADWMRRWRRPSLVTLGTGVVAFVLGLAALSEIPTSFAGFLIRERILTASVHTDSVQHMAMSNMLVEYGRASLGLHGLLAQPYHAFSHLLYGSISRGIGLPVSDVYGHATLLVFAPLLFAWIAGAAAAIVPRSSPLPPWPIVLAVLVCVAGFLGHDWFQRCTVWYSYLLSESQLVALVFFLAFVARIFADRPLPAWAAAVWLVVMTSTKVSVGLMAAVAYVVIVVVQGIRSGETRRARVQDLAVPLVTTMATAFIVMPAGNAASWNLLVFADRYFDQTCPVPFGRPAGGAWFLAYHFFFAWLALGLTWLAAGPAARDRRPTLMLTLAALVLAGFVPLSLDIPGGSAFYFSNVTTIFAIAVTSAHLAAAITSDQPRLWPWWPLAIGVGTLGVAGLAAFFPSQARRTIEALATPAAPADGANSAVIPYVREFQRLATSAPRDALVYVDKAEEGFWKLEPDCTRAALLIPALSGRPALFGLPDTECRQRIGRDYRPYAAVADAVSAENIPDGVLCTETRRLGFARVFTVKAEGALEIVCPE